MKLSSLKEFLDDRRKLVFAAVLLTGSLLSFVGFVNSRSFQGFVAGFGTGLAASFSAAYGLIEENRRKTVISAAVFILSAFFVFITFFGNSGANCAAWSPHTAENPVTGKCQAFIYGGCGPKPDPWYYQECGPDSKEKLCDRIPQEIDNSPERFERMVCMFEPDLEMELVDYSEENEKLELEVTENQFNTSNTRELGFTGKGEGFRILKENQVYNTSLLISRDQESVFNSTMSAGDRFTIVYDGLDSDNDGVEGADYREGRIRYTLEWVSSSGFEIETGGVLLNREQGFSFDHVYG